jgi:hypothetical protein
MQQFSTLLVTSIELVCDERATIWQAEFEVRYSLVRKAKAPRSAERRADPHASLRGVLDVSRAWRKPLATHASTRARQTLKRDRKRHTKSADLCALRASTRDTKETMTRHVSGTYLRTDRVRVRAGETVCMRSEDRRSARQVTLLEFSLSDMRLSSAVLPPVGATVAITIALRDRHVEFEVPAVVAWHREDEFTVTFDYLTARQAYGLTLALELERQAAALAQAPRATRAARG